MKRQPRVIWTKGMFLSPQHFQAQDLYFEDLLQFRFGASNYKNYGVTELRIDTEKLTNGLFKLVAARGVTPDGEAFDMPGSDVLPASREVGVWPSNDETLDIYLSLPDRRINARNVTLPGQREGSGPADTRYTSETIMMPDDNQGADEKPVHVGQKAFRLLFGKESRGGYSSIRIAQLERSPTGEPRLRASFVAPCLDLASSEYLMDLLRRQVDILLTKSAKLSGPRQEKGKAAAGFSAEDTDKFWLLHTVNSYLPEINHIYKTRHGHPEAAYVAMLRLAGALSTFSLKGGPGDLPDYDHDDLGTCFKNLDARIRGLMETVIPSKFSSIPLKLGDRQIWSGSIDDDNLFKNSQFYLAVTAEKMGVADIIRKVPLYLKMSGPDDIDRLVRTATPGVGLLHTQVVPPAIPRRLESQYFQVNQSGPHWDAIRLSRRISISAPAEIENPKMEVIVVWE
jgi:type VI secretion system protein ImpJ